MPALGGVFVSTAAAIKEGESLAPCEQPELALLAREFGHRIGDGAGMSVADLFGTKVAGGT
jgi:hypothetical protein